MPITLTLTPIGDSPAGAPNTFKLGLGARLPLTHCHIGNVFLILADCMQLNVFNTNFAFGLINLNWRTFKYSKGLQYLLLELFGVHVNVRCTLLNQVMQVHFLDWFDRDQDLGQGLG